MAFDPLPPMPFDDLLPHPMGADVRPDPLEVDWGALERGDVRAVVAVVHAWRLAGEQGQLSGHVLPYDRFDVDVGSGWQAAVHLSRSAFLLLGSREVLVGCPSAYSWRAHQSLPRESVCARNTA